MYIVFRGYELLKFSADKNQENEMPVIQSLIGYKCEHGIGEHGIGEHGIGGHGIGGHGIGEYGIGEHGIGEHGIGEQGIGEYGIGEHGIGEHGIGEHGIGEYGIGEMLRHPFSDTYDLELTQPLVDHFSINEYCTNYYNTIFFEGFVQIIFLVEGNKL